MQNKEPTKKATGPVNQPQLPLPWRRYLIWIVVLLIFSYYWFNLSQTQQRQTISYTAFEEKIRAEEVVSVTLQGDQVSGRLRETDTASVDETKTPLRFVTTLPPVDDLELISLLEQYEVDVYAKCDLREITGYLKNPQHYLSWVPRSPKASC